MKQNIYPLPRRIDVHCHFFNKQMLTWRLLVDFVQSRIKNPFFSGIDQVGSRSNRLNEIKRAIHFLKTGMQSSSEEVYKTLIKSEKEYAVVPLMFDLDYCMKGAPADLESEIRTFYQEILMQDREELMELTLPNDCINNNAHNDEVETEELIRTIDSLLDEEADRLTLITQEDSFLSQEKQLAELQAKYPDKVFPFFAVDPRRKENYTMENGTYDLSPILDRLFINGGHFYGIKLYAPNGYSPADPLLMALYEYCEQHAIPITAHCSGGGFASFAKTIPVHGLIYRNNKVEKHDGKLTFQHYKITDKERVHEKAQLLNHPLIWEKVLEKYPRLKLNLAHLGTSDESGEWSGHIIRLMKLYSNLYTDFSCMADKTTLSHIYKTYYAPAVSAIKSRFLYGSDFYLNMLFTDSMEQYLKLFEHTFTATEMQEITEINPNRFLAL